VRGLGALSCQTFSFVVSAAPRLSTSVLCVIGGPTFDGDQRDPGHLDPVALLHEQRLRERTTMARPKTRSDPRLQTRPYLHDEKKA
jgi:hypothetical protein